MAYLKTDPARAQIIARSSTSARVLSRYARDSRVTVRRLVAANDHTDLETNRYLHAWAWKRHENQVLVDTPVVCPSPTSSPHSARATKASTPWRALHTAVRNDGTADAYRQVMASGFYPVQQYLIGDVMRGMVEGYTLAEFLNAVDRGRLPNLHGRGPAASHPPERGRRRRRSRAWRRHQQGGPLRRHISGWAASPRSRTPPSQRSCPAPSPGCGRHWPGCRAARR